MASLQNLLTKAKEELNHIYTEPPAIRNGGRDEGWFCREHAMHSYFLLRLFGEDDARIEIGHFALRLPGIGITSFGSGADHAWCATDTHRPLDLSITFKYYTGYPQLTSAIMGERANGPYEIRCFEEEPKFLAAMDDQRPAVIYLPQGRVPNPESLLDRPENFLFDSGPGSWLQLYGAEAFARITLHVYKVAMSHVATFAHMSPQDAFSRIRSQYSAARLKVRRILTKA